MIANPELLALTSQVVASYVERQALRPDELPALIGAVYAALQAPDAPASDEPRPLTKAQIRRSITPDALISFEDGKPYKVLTRHLSGLGLTPQEYRQKWGLPGDYPMTAPSYSARRSEVAKSQGLGQRGRGSRSKALPARRSSRRGS